MIPLFVSAAVLLVAIGGLLAAADAALTVVSRNDIVDMAIGSRSGKALMAISNDIGAHINAVNFMRVVSCLLYTSPSPRDRQKSRMPSSA